MDTFQPLINILTLLTALSLAAERITNLIKLRTTKLRLATPDNKDAEKAREQAIALRSVIVGIVVAVLLKADLVAILRHANAPWETLGWFGMQGDILLGAPELDSPTAFATAILGSIAAGCSLGFGSKFWHELLDTVLELRNMAKKKNAAAE